MAGPTGLRYEAVYPLLDRMTTDPDQWRETFRDIRLMEGAAMKALSGTPLDLSDFVG